MLQCFLPAKPKLNRVCEVVATLLMETGYVVTGATVNKLDRSVVGRLLRAVLSLELWKPIGGRT